jgi:hypothetical protein
VKFSDLRWTCHICGQERPDEMIAVMVTDLSDEIEMPTGTLKQNVRYCIDNRVCTEAARTYRLLKPLKKL